LVEALNGDLTLLCSTDDWQAAQRLASEEASRSDHPRIVVEDFERQVWAAVVYSFAGAIVTDFARDYLPESVPSLVE